MSYIKDVQAVQKDLQTRGSAWAAINPDYVVRMRLQNRFKTGLDIARYTASIMRQDMADYDANSADYTQSLGCWHGFTAQQMMMAVKRHRKTVKKSYVYLSGWMVAALRSEFGPLPDQSMHEKTSVPALIDEIYTFLKQADARELRHLFVDLDQARKTGGDVDAALAKIDNFPSLPVVLWDERLSTAAVTRTLIDADASRARRAELVDKLAATYILQGYLDFLRSAK